MNPVRLLLAFVGCVLFYAVSAAPTLLWGDDAELQRIAITGEARAIGQSSAASHRLWQVVASAFVRWTTWLPLDEAGRVTLVSAIAASLAILPLALTIREISRQAGLATRAGAIGSVVGTVAFGLSHTFWLLASRPDAYTIQTFLLASALWGAVQTSEGRRAWPMLTVSVVAVGLALTNHVIILASVPGLVLLGVSRLRLTVRQRLRLAGASSLVVGGAIAVAEVLGFPWRALVSAILSYRPYVPSFRDASLVLGYLAYQFPLSITLMDDAREDILAYLDFMCPN